VAHLRKQCVNIFQLAGLLHGAFGAKSKKRRFDQNCAAARQIQDKEKRCRIAPAALFKL
jgi:hypothetical protein